MASRSHSARNVVSTRHGRLDQRARALVPSWRSTRAAQARGTDESGAILVLALVFLVAVSLIVTALLTWMGTSLSATGSFTFERNVEYAATDAVNLAIQNTRFSFDVGSPTPFLNNATPEACAAYTTSGQSVDVYCSMLWQPYSANTRVFTYSACSAGSPSDASPADCAAKPLLQAIVAFDDYPPGVAAPSPNPTPCQPISKNGSCGLSMTQVSWQWRPVVPAITSLSPSTGSITGGATVTIRGSGFAAGETVNFVLENPLAGSYNPPVAASVVANPAPGCALPTCLQVTSPMVTNGFAYYVEVITPGGTSQTVSNDYTSFVPTFTYSPVTPTVTALLGSANGSITGGTPVTIQGTGFWSTPNNQYPARVYFCPTGGGSCVPGTVVSIAPPVPGSNISTMSALTPAVSSASTYYVQVESYNQNSTQTNVIFTYVVQVPLIISLSPSSGGTGSTLTISGANFLTGSKVGFCADTNGNFNATCQTSGTGQIAATIVSLNSTQITVTVPSMTAGTYYPIVTLPSQYSTPPLGTGTTPPSQPYNMPADVFTHT